MESFTQMARHIAEQADEITTSILNEPPSSSYYESLDKCESMTSHVNELMNHAKEIWSEFRNIFNSGDCISAGSGRLRKARITCRRGGQRLNPEQLTRAAKILMQDQPHIVFVPKQAQSTFITVLFWASCDEQQLCSRMRHAWAVQQEVLNQGVKLTFQVECVFVLKNYLVYVVDKSSGYKLVNAKQPLPNEDDQAQFESVLETLHCLKTVEMPCAKRLRTD